ncbi:MAG TPA: ferritin-like domain-containing protein [Jatrophihabitans sp.]
MTTPAPTDPVVAALQAVLAAEHGAVFGYSLIGVRLSDPGQVDFARTLQATHRDVRDALMTDIARRGATPVEALPSYSPADKVTDATGAQRWALQLEQDCAAGYRYLLANSVAAGTAGAAARKQALSGLTGAAVNATRWRKLLTPATPTVAFPGV